MFKLKTNSSNKKELLERLGIVETKEYMYVLADNVSLFEQGKVNIIFDSNNLDPVKLIIKNIINGEDYYINLQNSEGIKRVNVKNIDYFEALDNDVFACLGKERFYVLEKLYSLEESLATQNFVRVSKSFLVNLLKINYIRPLLNYKLELVMINGDKIDVNRTYMKSFKKKMKL